jgi:hypothetical protein
LHREFIAITGIGENSSISLKQERNPIPSFF